MAIDTNLFSALFQGTARDPQLRLLIRRNVTHRAQQGCEDDLHALLAKVRPDWSWSKCRRYARRFINDLGGGPDA